MYFDEKPYKITDFSYGTGGFTEGLELNGLFEVKNTLNLAKKNEWAYVNSHFQCFSSTDNLKIAEFCENPTEIFYLQIVSDKDLTSFNDFITLSGSKLPKCIILMGNPLTINNFYAEKVVSRADGSITDNLFIVSLTDLGYTVYQDSFLESQFGVPQNKPFSIIIGLQSKEFQWSFDVHSYLKNTFTSCTVGEAISDLRCTNQYLDIKSDFQKYCRSGALSRQHLSWQETYLHRKNTIDKIKMVPEGGKFLDVQPDSNQRGYIRLAENEIAAELRQDFTNVTSNGPSLHYKENRTLTIREGCRLAGLRDNVTFDKKFNRTEISQVICNSFSPLVGQVFGGVLAKALN